MSRILVADDNSNIQKSVTHALATLGIDVVAVNNGEAAVRKLAEVSPDLVLADIFMPVRNGYEVCEYVKKDARFGHVPVILLAGAFDPFDEREAQRVGADGILKKPFVPPDPLIAMVKNLLDIAASRRLVAVSVSEHSGNSGTAQGEAGVSSSVAVHPGAPEISDEFPLEDTSSPARISFVEGEHPVAFGALLETPAAKPVESQTGALEPVSDEQILLGQRDSSLGDPVFWKNEAERESPEIETAAVDAPHIEEHTFVPKANALLAEHDIPVAEVVEPLDLVLEGQAENAPSVVDSGSVQLDPAEYAPLTVESGMAPELVVDPMEWLKIAPAGPPESAPEAIPSSLGFGDDVVDVKPLETPVVSSDFAAHIEDERANSVIEHPVTQQTPSNQVAETPEDTVRSITKQDWAHLSATEDSIPEKHLQEATASAMNLLSHSPVSESSQEMPAVPAPSAGPDPALVEAVVQRVLDKMRPQVVDIITQELLRPLVQALVHREIEKH